MYRMFVIVIPTIWKALRYMIMGMRVIRGNNGSVNRACEGDQEQATSETRLSEGGEHEGGDESSAPAMTRKRTPFKLGQSRGQVDRVVIVPGQIDNFDSMAAMTMTVCHYHTVSMPHAYPMPFQVAGSWLSALGAYLRKISRRRPSLGIVITCFLLFGKVSSLLTFPPNRLQLEA